MIEIITFVEARRADQTFNKTQAMFFLWVQVLYMYFLQQSYVLKEITMAFQ